MSVIKERSRRTWLPATLKVFINHRLKASYREVRNAERHYREWERSFASLRSYAPRLLRRDNDSKRANESKLNLNDFSNHQRHHASFKPRLTNNRGLKLIRLLILFFSKAANEASTLFQVFRLQLVDSGSRVVSGCWQCFTRRFKNRRTSDFWSI